MGDKQLHEFSDLSDFDNKLLYNVKNQSEPGKDMYIDSCAHMHDMGSQTVNTLNNIASDRVKHLNDQSYIMTTHMETTTANPQISINVKPDFIQPPIYYPVSLFDVVFHDWP